MIVFRMAPVFLLMTFIMIVPAHAQETQPETPVEETATETETTSEDVVESVKETTNEAIDFAEKKTGELTEQLDQNPQAQEYSAGILEPIYALAEYMAFPAFHWIAFAVMVSGVVSFALQLVLAKLAVLAHGGFSVSQILTDIQGLLISLVGLFLTTQAAAENSTFTSSATAVLSATVVGGVAGFVFYLWGQSEELQALKGRKNNLKESKKKS